MSDHHPVETSSAAANSAVSGQVSRRAFLAGSAAGVVGGGALAFSSGKLSPESRSDDRVHGTMSVRGDFSSSASESDAESLKLIVALIQQKYPDERLDEFALDIIRGNIAGQLQRSRVLSGFPLRSCDRPAPVFAPFFADEGEDL